MSNSQPLREPTRIQALKDLSILDTPPEERFERITRLARRLFDVPRALVQLEAGNRLWFRTQEDREWLERNGEHDLCRRMSGDVDLFMIPDARADERYEDEPVVKGEPGVRFVAGAPVTAPDGEKLGTLCVIDYVPRVMDDDDRALLRDLGDLVEHEFAALELATVDELTELINRRGFNAIALHTLALCRRMGRPATLLLFDLDDFKRINDSLGHAAGDRALRDFANDLQATFRDSDVVSRLGGDEFAVLMSGATPEDIRRPLTLLNVRVITRNERPETEATLSYTVGVAQYDPDVHHDIADLAVEADRRMYAAKGRHRGREQA